MYNSVDDLAKDRGRKIGIPGTRPGIRIVGTEAELDAIWEQYSIDGTPLVGSAYPGDKVVFDDRSEMGKRPATKPGGPVIDILGANGERVRIHVRPWPPTASGS